jgi:hypothetical protein
MAQFSSDTRRWLEAAIRQRKLLIRHNKSHKPEEEVLIALDLLEKLLKAYTYSVDLYMARFIHQYYKDICIILPGKGSSCSDKRQAEFRDIHLKAIQIIAGNIEFRELQTKKYAHETLF